MAKKIVTKEKQHIETVCDKVGEIAVHYGFTVIKPPHIKDDDVHKSRQFKRCRGF